jgi:hypothetical protein
MKLIKELLTLKEAASLPEFILVHHKDEEQYDLAAAIMKKFGFTDQGNVNDFADDINPDTKDHTHEWEEIGIWAAKKPSGDKIINAVEDHNYISTDD